MVDIDDQLVPASAALDRERSHAILASGSIGSLERWRVIGGEASFANLAAT